MKTCIYESPCGKLYLEARDGRLTRCSWLPESRGADSCESPGNRKVLATAVAQLDEYFAGLRREFDLPLLLDGTDFRVGVWRRLMQIPYGSLTTYGEMAREIGCPGGQRAVAQACSRNRMCVIIPCHRVISSGGKLGGYTAVSGTPRPGTSPEGINIKQFLLHLERES